MTDALYARAQAIAHEVLDLAVGERAARLDARCSGDAALRREVEWLMAASDDTALDDMPREVVLATTALTEDLRIKPGTPGSYRLIERLGEGGMGVVWLAEREVGGAVQRVALKRLFAGSVARHARFQEEQRILAALNHPNIARLVDAGDDSEGEPFLAMDYIQGKRIDRWCDDRGLDLRARVGLFLKVCAAVSYAHERLVIHRDIKPDNLLVDEAGEPKLLDFGIARLVDADALLTSPTRMMTPAYASPEQIEGTALGTATDVWSLGVVLYELVAGVRPFEHISGDLARANLILSGRITPPSQQAPRDAGGDDAPPLPGAGLRKRRIPADIDAIVLKALRRKPEQRYASVRELAEDLERFLDARPVLARRGRLAYHAQRYVQRHRWPLAVGALLVAVVAGFTWRTVLAEREARLQAQVAEQTAQFLMSAFSLSDPTQADRHDFTAREVLDRSRDRVDKELANQPRLRARLLESLGNAYSGINEGAVGARLLENAARLNLGPAVNDPVAAGRSLRSKAIAIRTARGSTEDAEHAAQRGLDLLARHLDGDAPLVADAYGTLALTLSANGKDFRAVESARKSLALRQAGNAGPLAIARSHSDLCSVIGGTGEFKRALPHCRRAVALHGQAGTTRTNEYRQLLKALSEMLGYAGDNAGAQRVARQRLVLTRQLFGEGHSVLASDRVALAGLLAASGIFAESRALLDQGLPGILRHSGARSPQYAAGLLSAGLLAYEQGEFAAAARLFRQSHDVFADVSGDSDNNQLLVARTMLATALIASGGADAEARALLESVIAARSRWNIADAALAYARLPLAQWHVANGGYEEAEALLDQVEAVGNRVELELHARVAATRARIARARGDAARAVDFDRSAFDITRRDRGAMHPRTARYALAYAHALRESGTITEAKAMEDEYRQRFEAAYPSSSEFRARR